MLTLVTPGAALPESTTDIPDQLRSIAGDVETGELIGARSAAVIVKGIDGALMVYGIGPGTELDRLNAAYMLLGRALRELELVAQRADV